ncbi:TetR/AcrR family transcriptional regulator [Nocardia sp. CA-290969]|uniref:TetR/AcrR family transcriptional regulator n=1 Tax=Nocardia sp. CA-290969 TaxID=3239986 RepID=UPI003D8A1857
MPNNDKTKPQHRRRRARAEAILDAAAALFATAGYTGTSLADVAEKVDLTPKALYHYYPSKRELLEEVLIRQFRYFDMDVLESRRTAWQRLGLFEALVESSIEALQQLFDHRELLRVSFTETFHGSERIQSRHEIFQKSWISHVEAIVDSYAEVPARLRSELADHLVAILFGAAVDAILRPRPDIVGAVGTAPSRNYVESVVRNLLEGVLRTDGDQPSAPE